MYLSPALLLMPTGPFASGLALLTATWGLFKALESIASEHAKVQAACWLFDLEKVSSKIRGWPHTCASLFEKVFGKKALSWKCVVLSGVLSIACFLILGVVFLSHFFELFSSAMTITGDGVRMTLCNAQVVLFALPAGLLFAWFINLLWTRLTLRLIIHSQGRGDAMLCLAVNVGISLWTAAVLASVGWNLSISWWMSGSMRERLPNRLTALCLTALDSLTAEFLHPGRTLSQAYHGSIRSYISPQGLMAYPSCVPSLWLVVYPLSGLLLKGSRRFEAVFSWFNHYFDIEKHPLQSIGVVAGALVALVYWAAVIVSRVVG